jgi:hypothetical protein
VQLSRQLSAVLLVLLISLPPEQTCSLAGIGEKGAQSAAAFAPTFAAVEHAAVVL